MSTEHCKYLLTDCEGKSFGSSVLNTQQLDGRARDIIFRVYCKDSCESCPVYQLKERLLHQHALTSDLLGHNKD